MLNPTQPLQETTIWEIPMIVAKHRKTTVTTPGQSKRFTSEIVGLNKKAYLSSDHFTPGLLGYIGGLCHPTLQGLR